MGQQQLLLIVLAVIVIGISITMGILLFNENAIEQKRNEIINECSLIASDAQLYYRKPRSLGGGSKSFTGWTVPQKFTSTVAGFFVSTIVTPNQVIITGTGNDVVTGGDSVKVQLTVSPLKYTTQIIN